MDEAVSWDADIQRELGKENFVRAAMLAQQRHYPPDAVRYLQESALRTYAFKYRNLPGLQKLVSEYGIPSDEVRMMLEQELERHGDYAKTEKSMQYTTVTMTPMTLEEWIDLVCSKI